MNTFFAFKTNETTLALNADESWHCAKVLRMKSGEAIEAIDGNGLRWEARLLAVSEKQTTASITKEYQFESRNYHFHLAVAPVKNIDRLEWLAEKATELGVDRISLLACRNSERRTVNTIRLKKIIESAVKQSRQVFMPQLDEIQSLETFLSSCSGGESAKLIAHCVPQNRSDLGSIITSQNKFIFLVGPEGDFRKEEIQLALESGFNPVTLGESRLRTETAAVYIAAYLRSKFH